MVEMGIKPLDALKAATFVNLRLRTSRHDFDTSSTVAKWRLSRLSPLVASVRRADVTNGRYTLVSRYREGSENPGIELEHESYGGG